MRPNGLARSHVIEVTHHSHNVYILRSLYHTAVSHKLVWEANVKLISVFNIFNVF